MTYSVFMLLLSWFLVVFALPFLFIVYILAVARRLRRTYVIPAHPRLIATPAEAVPPELAAVLAEVTPALEQLGFTAVANVHAPEFGPALTWTQVLYLNRERGERANILCLRRLPGPTVEAAPLRPTLAFATEWADGKSIKTAVVRPTAQATFEAYQRHRADIAAKAGENRDTPGIVPEPGLEPQWLQDRAGLIAKAIAAKLPCTYDPQADCYRINWRRAISAARKVSRMRRSRTGPGFSVIPPPISPADNDPPADA